MRCASQIIGKLASASAEDQDPLLDLEALACAAWATAVGKRLARFAKASKLVRGRLVVEVEDATWQRSLFTMTRQILDKVQTAIGSGIVTSIEFRIMPPRREPQRATVATPLLDAVLDDADSIGDPGLRRIYKNSRRQTGNLKETA